jgi:uncharacterized membrane protein YraQ (UPF0718 family)
MKAPQTSSRNLNMLIPTIIMAAIAIILLYIGYIRGQGQHVMGLKSAWTMTWQVLPLLIFAFIAAGMIQVLIPEEIVTKWVGGQSGWRGILIGCVAGGLTPGGPYVSLPIVAGLAQAGAAIPTLVAYLTAWSIYAVARLPMEVGLMGPRFVFVRLCTSFLLPPLAGWITMLLFPKG